MVAMKISKFYNYKNEICNYKIRFYYYIFTET